MKVHTTFLWSYLFRLINFKVLNIPRYFCSAFWQCTDILVKLHMPCVLVCFCGVFYVVTLLLDFSVGAGAFVIELSKISYVFFSYMNRDLTKCSI